MNHHPDSPEPELPNGRGDAGGVERGGQDRIGEATIHRFIHRSRDLIVARADFGQLISAYEDHVRRWENQIDGLAMILISQGLGAAALHLSCRKSGEIVGWTINIREPATNLFITGDSGQRTVTGRVFSENVKTAASSRMFVQISSPGKPLSQSTVDVVGLDVLEMFDQFYAQSEQTPARFFEIDDREYMMLLGLPDVDEDWLRDLSLEEAIDIAGGEVKSLGHVVFAFRCGCNPELIMELMVNLYAEHPEELFGDDLDVEVLCPRCGRRWTVDRLQFDAAVEAAEPDADDRDADDPCADEQDMDDPDADEQDMDARDAGDPHEDDQDGTE